MKHQNLTDWFYPRAKEVSTAALGYEQEWQGRIPILVEEAWLKQQEKIDKLKQLLLLADPMVSHITMGETQSIQWNEFIREYNEEA
jgi:hypothetical protein